MNISDRPQALALGATHGEAGPPLCYATCGRMFPPHGNLTGTGGAGRGGRGIGYDFHLQLLVDAFLRHRSLAKKSWGVLDRKGSTKSCRSGLGRPREGASTRASARGDEWGDVMHMQLCGRRPAVEEA